MDSMRRKLAAPFQPTLPARGATHGRGLPGARPLHFNPRSPHGERLLRHSHPHRGGHFNPRSPHGERRLPPQRPCGRLCISTHAPRTGSDNVVVQGVRVVGNFNPRSPHGERPIPLFSAFVQRHFNPRSPHGERLASAPSGGLQIYFNPRSPHGERPARRHGRARPQKISTHAPRTGSDTIPLFPAFVQRHFNPRSPHGERRRCPPVQSPASHFNPRSPHGERHVGQTPEKVVS